MASNLHISDHLADLQALDFSTEANDGFIRIYDGIQPATADNPTGTALMLVELRLGNPAFGAPLYGTVTANSISPGKAVRDGIAAWFRVLKSDGATVIADGSAGIYDSDLALSTASISSGATVAISGFSHTVTK